MFSEDEIREKYADFLEHFGDNIERFCYVYSSSHNDAVDLMQEIFLAVWVGLPKLAPDTTHRQANRWLYKLMTSVLLKQLRHRNELRLMPTELLPDPPPEEDFSELVEELTADLPESDKALVDDLLYGYKIPEIAERHRLSIGATNTRLSRIKDKLRNIYNEHYGKQQ